MASLKVIHTCLKNLQGMAEVAENVKLSKEANRLNVLMEGLHGLHSSLVSSPTCLPLSPSLYVTGIEVRTSSYFPSNTLPLKINFTSDEAAIIPAIFKVRLFLRRVICYISTMSLVRNKLYY